MAGNHNNLKSENEKKKNKEEVNLFIRERHTGYWTVILYEHFQRIRKKC